MKDVPGRFGCMFDCSGTTPAITAISIPQAPKALDPQASSSRPKTATLNPRALNQEPNVWSQGRQWVLSIPTTTAAVDHLCPYFLGIQSFFSGKRIKTLQPYEKPMETEALLTKSLILSL